MKSIALHFHGPLQSWAGASMVKTRVDTNREPSSRAVRGLVLAAFGVPRGETHQMVETAHISDPVKLRAGRVVRDFQTIGSRSDEEFFRERVGRILEQGKRSSPFVSANGATMIVNRTYLADAAFLVFITGKNDEETHHIHQRLLRPVWSPYLGKRAFAPTFPFILGVLEASDENAMKKEALAKLSSFGFDRYEVKS